MDELLEIAAASNLVLIEDAAHCLLATYRDRPLGGIGAMGTFSFHHTKNVTSGEGGALLVNDPALRERAEIVWEKGTDRSSFLRGEVDRYTWRDVGSSFGASEITAAFLWGQLEIAEQVTALRRAIWDRYHEAFAQLEDDGLAQRPVVPAGVQAQRPPLPPDPAQRGGPGRLHRRAARQGDRGALPLHPAPQLAGRPRVRARRGRSGPHRRPEQAARPSAAVGGPGRGLGGQGDRGDPLGGEQRRPADRLRR